MRHLVPMLLSSAAVVLPAHAQDAQPAPSVAEQVLQPALQSKPASVRAASIPGAREDLQAELQARVERARAEALYQRELYPARQGVDADLQALVERIRAEGLEQRKLLESLQSQGARQGVHADLGPLRQQARAQGIEEGELYARALALQSGLFAKGQDRSSEELQREVEAMQREVERLRREVEERRARAAEQRQAASRERERGEELRRALEAERSRLRAELSQLEAELSAEAGARERVRAEARPRILYPAAPAPPARPARPHAPEPPAPARPGAAPDPPRSAAHGGTIYRSRTRADAPDAKPIEIEVEGSRVRIEQRTYELDRQSPGRVYIEIGCKDAKGQGASSSESRVKIVQPARGAEFRNLEGNILRIPSFETDSARPPRVLRLEDLKPTKRGTLIVPGRLEGVELRGVQGLPECEPRKACAGAEIVRAGEGCEPASACDTLVLAEEACDADRGAALLVCEELVVEPALAPLSISLAWMPAGMLGVVPMAVASAHREPLLDEVQALARDMVLEMRELRALVDGLHGELEILEQREQVSSR